MNKIFSKIFIGYLIIIAVFTIPVIYFSFNTISENYQQNLINQENHLTHALESYMLPFIEENEFGKLDSISKYLGTRINSRITFIDLKGKVLADSKANPNTMDNHLDRPEIIQAIQNGFGTSIRHSYSVNKDMLYVATPLKNKDSVLGVLRLSIFMDDYIVLINSLKDNLLMIILSVIAFSLLIAFLLSKTFSKPIIGLALDSQKVAEGDFTIRTKIKSNDEIQVLGDSFNVMIEKLEQLFKQTNSQKDELNKIISSIQEGLVVINTNGIITLCNDSFKSILGLESVIGKSYREIFRDNEATKHFKSIIESESNVSLELDYKDEHYICSANHINDNNEIVVIFYNISQLKKLENMKKDFVVNVSHELRTPLTVIKGYIETLEEEITDGNQKYIKIIKNHTNRLINIVQDLLSISQLEANKFKLDIAKMDLNELFTNLKNTFEQKLKEKNIVLNIENNINEFTGDSFKIEQMFINLVDNALKYTEKGSINIYASSESNYTKFEVIDTGIGIPAKDQDRIFERFYTVDKSRSRQNDGTGLGLSIVKHIVNLHKGRISLESQIDIGTKFTIIIPNHLI